MQWARGMRLSDTFKLLQITWAGLWHKILLVKEFFSLCEWTLHRNQPKNPLRKAAGSLPKYDHPSAHKITALALYQCS